MRNPFKHRLSSLDQEAAWAEVAREAPERSVSDDLARSQSALPTVRPEAAARRTARYSRDLQPVDGAYEVPAPTAIGLDPQGGPDLDLVVLRLDDEELADLIGRHRAGMALRRTAVR